MGSTVVLSSSISLDCRESTNLVLIQVGQSPLPALWWQKCLWKDQNKHQNSVFWYEICIQNTIFFNLFLELFTKKRHWQVKRTKCASFSSVIFYFIRFIQNFFPIALFPDRHQIIFGAQGVSLALCKQARHWHLCYMVLSLYGLWASMLTEDEKTVWSANFKTNMFYA